MTRVLSAVGRVAAAGGTSDHPQWVEASKGAKVIPGSNFGYSGPMTEAVLLGNVAVCYPGQKLLWDAEKLAFTNNAEANGLLHYECRKGWEL